MGNVIEFGITPAADPIGERRNALARLCPEQRLALMSMADNVIMSIAARAEKEYTELSSKLGACEAAYRDAIKPVAQVHGEWATLCVASNYITELAQLMPEGEQDTKRVFDSAFFTLWQEELASIIKSEVTCKDE